MRNHSRPSFRLKKQITEGKQFAVPENEKQKRNNRWVPSLPRNQNAPMGFLTLQTKPENGAAMKAAEKGCNEGCNEGSREGKNRASQDREL